MSPLRLRGCIEQKNSTAARSLLKFAKGNTPVGLIVDTFMQYIQGIPGSRYSTEAVQDGHAAFSQWTVEAMHIYVPSRLEKCSFAGSSNSSSSPHKGGIVGSLATPGWGVPNSRYNVLSPYEHVDCT